MGADFIYAVGEQPTEETRDKARFVDGIQAIAGLDTLGYSPEDFETPDEARGYLIARIDEAIDHLTSGARDYGIMHLPDQFGTPYVISGGMSWGDDPTDACRHIWLLNAVGLC